jgi:hypothetical protein
MKYPPQGGEPQLFDLKKDPAEKANLAKKNPDRVKELSTLLDGWYKTDQRKVGKVSPATPKPKRKPKKRNL